MTAAQLNRLRGFEALLTQRGLSVTIGSTQLTGLQIPDPVPPDDFEPVLGHAAYNLFRFRLADLEDLNVTEGTELTDEEGRTHRALRVYKNDLSPVAEVFCTSAT